jgi:hypothetical protein
MKDFGLDRAGQLFLEQVAEIVSADEEALAALVSSDEPAFRSRIEAAFRSRIDGCADTFNNVMNGGYSYRRSEKFEALGAALSGEVYIRLRDEVP